MFQTRLSSLIAFLFCTLTISLMIGCASTDKNADTPEGLFAIAQDYEKNERYELAVQKYNEVRNKFPYSSLAIKAELAAADVHFKSESWPEAQLAYQTFRELHPKHSQIDYVTFRIGLSYYNQLPDTVDRDLTLAKDAVAAFDSLLTTFPKSSYATEAREKRADCLKRLAGKEEYIGDFYFKRGLYDSALPRYETLLQSYSGLGFDARALSRAAIAASKTDQRDKAQRYLAQLKQSYPESDELANARREIE